MKHRTLLAPLGVLGMFIAVHSARADFFHAVDPGAGPTATRPVSDQALSTFLATTAGMESRLIDFEGLSGSGQPGLLSSSMPLGHGVTLESSHLDALPPPGFQYGLTNIPNSSTVQSNARLGYNISGTARFTVVPVLNAGTASVLFRSDTPFNSVGFYLTGLGNQSGHLDLVIDGMSPYGVTGSGDGGALFVGFLGNPDSQFRTMELRVSGISGPTRDVFAIDDIRFSLVPEPRAFVSFGAGMGLSLIAWLRARRRRRD